MTYILEGGDLAGKSTFANALSNSLHVPIVKKRFDLIKDIKGELKENFIEQFNHIFFKTIEPLINSGIDAIFDRALISSIVFSKFFKRDYDLTYIYEFIKNNNVKIIILWASEETLEKRYKERGEALFSLEEVKIINQAFVDAYYQLSGVEEFKGKIFLFESTDTPIEEFVISEEFMGLLNGC